MKRLLLGFFFIGLLLCTAQAQVIYVSSLTNELYRLDIRSCQLTLVTQTQDRLFDIAFHPDGSLYGITPDGLLVEVDTTDGSFDEAYDFLGANFNSLTTSAAGIIYAIGSEGDLWSYNPADGVARYYGNVGFIAAGDLTFRKGQLYLAALYDMIVRIDINNPANSAVVINENVRGDIFGIVSFAENCEEVTTYAITDQFSEIFEINFNTGTLGHICSLPIEVGGGASTYEFLGSSGLEASIVSVTPGSCFEHAGSITFNVEGGVGSLTYSIDELNFTDSPVFSNLGNGDYTLTAMDSVGCTITFPFSIMALDGPVINSAMVTYETCDADNGVIRINATGGEQPLQYALDDGNFQLTGEFVGLTGGSYTVQVVDQAGCATDTLIQLLSVAPSFFTGFDIQDTRCDSANGQITIKGATGYPPFEFALTGYPAQSGNVFDQLLPGSYVASLTDRYGCVHSETFTIKPSTHPEIEDVIIRHATCGEPNGLATIISLDQGQVLAYSIDGSTFQAAPSFTDLPADTYTFYMRDKSGCIVSRQVDLHTSRPIQMERLTISEASCGDNDGVIEFALTNATEPVIAQLNGRNPDIASSFTSLAAGEYVLHVTDAMGCEIDTVITLQAALCPVYFPTIFSPNGDGINDYFSLSSIGPNVWVTRYSIYDRWGNGVFEAINFSLENGDSNWWDGTMHGVPAPGGVYAYRIEIVFDDRVTKVFTGDISVIR